MTSAKRAVTHRSCKPLTPSPPNGFSFGGEGWGEGAVPQTETIA
ncbi:MAG: hypothetical protein OJF61_001996 [Rhodanobacteraceae bacterium]|nr:MAG: hypothetical protein OJF61_001996 [Rhodanobacteraceae bacterium]